MKHKVITGDVADVLPALPANHFHGVFCDPPYGLSFMGKSWDHGAPSAAVWAEVLRVCRPGAHLMAFGGTRTFHRLACAIEDAGWEIRDMLMWVYGSGFPKSLDVSKAIDKESGVKPLASVPASGVGFIRPDGDWNICNNRLIMPEVTTPAAQQWSGYGTALKPAYEPVILARKPLDRTVAANVQKWGCGALWIDGGRVATQGEEITNHARGKESAKSKGKYGDSKAQETHQTAGQALGRWPANLLHDGSDEVVAGMGEAARYFYCPKASQAERNAGCEALPSRTAGEVTGGRQAGSAGLESPRAGAGRTAGSKNHHPTVKPISLCEYLSKLILPAVPGNLLVPFSGSGSEMIGSLQAGWASVTGIEKELEYVGIAQARIAHHEPLILKASNPELWEALYG